MKIHIENNHNIHEKDQVYIDAYGDVIDVILAMSFLQWYTSQISSFLLCYFLSLVFLLCVYITDKTIVMMIQDKTHEWIERKIKLIQ